MKFEEQQEEARAFFVDSLSQYKIQLRPVGWRALISKLVRAIWWKGIQFGQNSHQKKICARGWDAGAGQDIRESGAGATLRRYKIHLRYLPRPQFWTRSRQLVVGGIVGWVLVLGSANLALRRTGIAVVTPTPMILPTRVVVVPAYPTATSTVVPTRIPLATSTPIFTKTVSVIWKVQPYPYRIEIPSIGVDARVIPVGWTIREMNGKLLPEWEVASYAAGWHYNSAKPGQGGNIVIAGHHNIEGEVFKNVVNLEPGMEIILHSEYARYEYVVDEKIKLLANGISEEQRRDNAQYIEPTSTERLTLVTCWPYYDNTHRVVVLAKPKYKPD